MALQIRALCLNMWIFWILPFARTGQSSKTKKGAFKCKKSVSSQLYKAYPPPEWAQLKDIVTGNLLTYSPFQTNRFCLTEKPSHCANFFHDRSKLQLPAASFPSWEHSSQSETWWIYGSYLGHGASASSQLKVPRLHSRPRILQRSQEESTGKKDKLAR